jgi:hypothetical protein
MYISCVQFGAPDGKTDDTVALQKVLTNFSNNYPDQATQKPMTVYFPPGVYVISQTLVGNKSVGGAFIGHGRDTTIKWAGAKNGTMFWSAGMAYHRYAGLHWDGAGIAGFGILHQSENQFETEIIHEAEAFSNFLEVGLAVKSGGICGAKSPDCSKRRRIMY